MAPKAQKAVITVVGKDTVGIIARVCTCLAERHVNILDIQQTLIADYLNMIMIVDAGKSTVSFDVLQDDLAQLGVEIGLEIRCQREEIFEMMHRI